MNRSNRIAINYETINLLSLNFPITKYILITK